MFCDQLARLVERNRAVINPAGSAAAGSAAASAAAAAAAAAAADENISFTVVDCRYPYEFDGGHIAVSYIDFLPLDLSSICSQILI